MCTWNRPTVVTESELISKRDVESQSLIVLFQHLSMQYRVRLTSIPSIYFIFLNINNSNKNFTCSEHAVPRSPPFSRMHPQPTPSLFIAFIVNLHELGVSKWEDRTSKGVTVSKPKCVQTIHRKINQNMKRVSIITCISAAGKT
jgi:hypothetical protein